MGQTTNSGDKDERRKITILNRKDHTMTTQEAIEQMKIRKYCLLSAPNPDASTEAIIQKQIDALDLAISALKKQIPNQSSCFWCVDKSPMIVEKETERGFQGDLLLSEIEFCPKCGQRLK